MTMNPSPSPETTDRLHPALQALIESIPERERLILFGQEAFSTLVVLLIALGLYFVVSRLLSKLNRNSHLDASIVATLRTVTRWLFFIFTLAAVLQVWNVLDQFWAATTAFVTLVAIGFVAVWSVLSNVLCSIILLASRPFRIGQTIELPPDNLGGSVQDITLLHTVLLTEQGDELKIPNNLFFQRVIRLKHGTDEPAFEQQDSVEV